jgi:hypothetical protein
MRLRVASISATGESDPARSFAAVAVIVPDALVTPPLIDALLG